MLEPDVSTIGSSNTGPVAGGYLKLRCWLFRASTMDRRNWTEPRFTMGATRVSVNSTNNPTITHNDDSRIEAGSGREYKPKTWINWDSEQTPSDTTSTTCRPSGIVILPP